MIQAVADPRIHIHPKAFHAAPFRVDVHEQSGGFPADRADGLRIRGEGPVVLASDDFIGQGQVVGVDAGGAAACDEGRGQERDIRVATGPDFETSSRRLCSNAESPSPSATESFSPKAARTRSG